MNISNRLNILKQIMMFLLSKKVDVHKKVNYDSGIYKNEQLLENVCGSCSEANRPLLDAQQGKAKGK